MSSDFSFESLAQALAGAADAPRAEQMSAYMRHQFSFYGLAKPQRASLSKPFLKAWKQAQISPKEVCTWAWEQDQREWVYIALDYLDLQKTWNLGDVDWIAELICNKSWWDSVDLLASHALGGYFKQYPQERDPYLETWLAGENLWLHRSCLIFQLGYGKQIDLDLLFALCERFSSHQDFFIQKAMGWALRQAHRHFPQAIEDFVAQQPLPALSRREALKHA